MKITMTGRQVEVPADLKQIAEKRLAKLDKFFPDDAAAIIKLKKKRSMEVVELTIQDAGIFFRSEKSADTYQTALDEGIDAIVRQIRKNKTRLEKRLREGAFVKDAAPEALPEVEEQKDFEIRYKTFRFKPMSPEEAILQMNLLEHGFFVFENDETGKVNVVYAREDGEYGCIEPEN